MNFFGRLTLIAPVLLATSLASAATTVKNIRLWADNGRTRVVLDLSGPASHSIFTLRGPDRLVVDLKDSKLAGELGRLPTGGSIRWDCGVVKRIRL